MKRFRLIQGLVQNIKVGKKIALGYGIITGILVIVALTSLFYFQQIAKQNDMLEAVNGSKSHMQEARIAQQIYVTNKSAETADLVLQHLEAANASMGQAKTMMTSPDLLGPAGAFEEQLDLFTSEFIHYLELEKAKANQNRLQMTIGSNLVLDIKRAMDVAQFHIMLAEDPEKMSRAFDRYLTMQKSFDAVMEARVASSKYMYTESTSHLELLRNGKKKARDLLLVSIEEAATSTVEENLHVALDSLNKFESAFDHFDQLVADQRVQYDNMTAAAMASSDIAMSIANQVGENNNKIIQTSSLVAISSLLVGLLFSVGTALVLTLEITRPLQKVMDQMKMISEYDLTHPMEEAVLIRKDEMGILARESEDIRKALLTVIGEISEASTSVYTSSKEMTDKGQIAAATAVEISETVEEIASSAEEQAQVTVNGFSQVTQLGKLLAFDLDQVKALMEVADRVEELKDEGMGIVDGLVEETKESSQATGEVHDIVQATNESAQKIKNASSMIADIADQTNLLALNAAIEAGRAGDSGRGFAVVAEEIRKLAVQTNRFTKEISRDIKDLMAKSTQAVDTIEIAGKAVRKQEKDVLHTSDKFRGIAVALGSMRTHIQGIDQSGVKMAGQMASINSLFEALADISTVNEQGTSRAAAGMQEQAMVIDLVSASCAKLVQLAGHMDEAVSVFKIKDVDSRGIDVNSTDFKATEVKAGGDQDLWVEESIIQREIG